MRTKIFFPSQKVRIAAMIIMIAIISSAVTKVTAQTTDLSGDWKLNKELSQLMTEFTMAPQTVNIVQEGDSLIVQKVQDMMGQVMNTNEKYTMDGEECSNPGYMDAPKISKALWNEAGLALWIYSSMNIQGESIGITEVYYLDEDRRLRLDYSIQTSMGDMAESYAFDKQ